MARLRLVDGSRRQVADDVWMSGQFLLSRSLRKFASRGDMVVQQQTSTVMQ